MSPFTRSLSYIAFLQSLLAGSVIHAFNFEEATVGGIQQAFHSGELTSRQLTEFYLNQIQELNRLLHAVIEVNPNALAQADSADRQRKRRSLAGSRRIYGRLHGVPVLLKDNIATKDKLNTTAGSFALLGSTVPRDAGVVRRLRSAGAVILGKASLSEWANFRSLNIPNGWSARGGQGKNAYVMTADPCGSSSGSAIAAAANLAAVTLGSETDGSIICPSAVNSVVGIKPTVGLTSRSGVIPISPRQDTIGPICRTVSDAVDVLEAIVGYDSLDAEATRAMEKFIPQGGYRQFLTTYGLKGKRLGILRKYFFDSYPDSSVQAVMFDKHFQTLRERGAILMDGLEIENTSTILNLESGEEVAWLAEFKQSLNRYLGDLLHSPVRSLADVITFNNKHKDLERTDEFGQIIFLQAQNTSGLGPVERKAIDKMHKLSKNGLEKLIKEKHLDAIVTPDYSVSSILAIGGYPGISVPAGYDSEGIPFGVCFGGLKGSEPTLIEIAYAFEQATMVRKPPSVNSSDT